jgi:hypothetical protein
MTRRTDPIFEVFDAQDAFRTTPSEDETQQVIIHACQKNC